MARSTRFLPQPMWPDYLTGVLSASFHWAPPTILHIQPAYRPEITPPHCGSRRARGRDGSMWASSTAGYSQMSCQADLVRALRSKPTPNLSSGWADWRMVLPVSRTLRNYRKIRAYFVRTVSRGKAISWPWRSAMAGRPAAAYRYVLTP